MNHEEIKDREHLRIDVTALPPELPLLPTRDVVVFTSMLLPLFVGRDRSIQAVEESLATSRLIFLATQKEQQEEDQQRHLITDRNELQMLETAMILAPK